MGTYLEWNLLNNIQVISGINNIFKHNHCQNLTLLRTGLTFEIMSRSPRSNHISIFLFKFGQKPPTESNDRAWIRPFQGGASFVFFSVLWWPCLCARLFVCALRSPAGRGLASWLLFVVSGCEFVALGRVRCVVVSVPDLCILAYFHANQIYMYSNQMSMCLDPHLNRRWGWRSV